MLTLPRPARRLAPLLALAAAGAASAGELEIAPVLVELGPTARTALVTVRNAGAATARYQVKGFEWGQSPDGQMALSPAGELVLFPPLVELQPGESRNVRVGTSAAPGQRERSWRVFVEEMPRAEEAGASRVQVLTRVGIPVFLEPQARASRGEVAFLARDGRNVRFAVRNLGTVRLRPQEVRLVLKAPDGKVAFEKVLDAWYVLAGGERVYDVEVPPEACARGEEIAAVAILEAGTLEARTTGSCGGPAQR